MGFEVNIICCGKWLQALLPKKQINFSKPALVG